MSLRRFCQPVCYFIKSGGVRYAFVAVGTKSLSGVQKWQTCCLFCESYCDEPAGLMFKCDKCDGPRHHVSCLNKQVQANMSLSMNGPICQWCSPYPRYVFTADQVRMARNFVEGIGFHDDPENPNRKERALKLLEFHEFRVSALVSALVSAFKPAAMSQRYRLSVSFAQSFP